MNRITILFSVFLLILISSCGSKKTIYQSSKSNKQPSNTSRPTGKKLSYSQKIYRYIDTHSESAMEEMRQYKIPASITLAQGILESGSGQSQLARRSHNHFGIKCHSGWKGGRVYHDDDRKGECFRKYNHPRESFRDHSLFLKKKRYAFLFRYNITNYKAWAQGLRKAGYATDRKYPQKLIDLIERYELHAYDRHVLGKKYKKPKKDSSNSTSGNQTTTYKVHIVKKGDTLYSLSRKYKMTVNNLKRLNNLPSNTLSIGQRLKLK